MPFRSNRRLLISLVGLLSLMGNRRGLSENGYTSVLPKSPNQAVNGLQVEINPRGVEGNGYRPVRVKVKTARGMPSRSERQVLVRLSPDGNYWEPEYIYEKLITLPANATFVEDMIPVRQTSAPDEIRVTVFEGGDVLRECRGGVRIGRTGDHTEMWPSMLFVDSRAPGRKQQQTNTRAALRDKRASFVDYRAIASLSPASTNRYHGSPPNKKQLPADQFHYGGYTRPRAIDVLSQLEREPRCSLMPPKEIPSNWRDLSSLDIAFISIRDLEALQQVNPKGFEALADWTRSGRSLFVFRDRPAKVASAPSKKNKKVKDEPPLEPSPYADTPRAELKQKIDGLIGSEFRSWIPASAGRDDALNEYELADTNRRTTAKLNFTKQIKVPFAEIRDCGLGRIVYVDESPFTMAFGQRALLLNSIGIDNWSWRQRNGISMLTQNSVFWLQLIPGLGLPPVNLFLISMTLFVILIGPVAYYFLRKHRKLFLIMVIAPAASSLMLAALLAYAFLSDGSGMKVRVRGITYLDARAGRAASMSYQTYYSAMGGGAELRFPNDTTVFPVLFLPNSRSRRSEQSVVNWTDGQRLQEGYLRPRTMTQFAVNRAAATSMSLEVKRDKDSVQVVNGLRTEIVSIYIRDEDGFHACDRIGQGDTQLLTPIDATDLKTKTHAIFENAALSLPEGFSEDEYLDYAPRIYYGQTEDHAFGYPTYKNGLIERKLDELLVMPERTPVGGYVAIVKFSPASPVGSDSPERFENLEVIFGRWK